MATNLQIRITDGTSFGTASDNSKVFHPETSPQQVKGLLDETGKIDLSLISSALLGAHKNIGAITTTPIQLYELYAKILENALGLGIYVRENVTDPAAAHQDINNIMTGRFFQVQNVESSTLNNAALLNADAKLNPIIKDLLLDFYGGDYNYNFSFIFDGDDGVGTDKTVENGDFVVFNSLDFAKPVINENNIVYSLYDVVGGNDVEIVSGYEGTTDIVVSYHNRRYVNPTTRKITYGAVNVKITGNNALGVPHGQIKLVVGGKELLANVSIQTYTVAGITMWDINHTFYDIELEFDAGAWGNIYSVVGTPNEVVVHFGVINNTYGQATENMRGVVQLASEAEVIAGANTLKVVTPAGAKKSVETFGLKVSQIPSANETTRGLVEIATSSEIVLPVGSLSASLIPSVLRTKEMIDYWGSIPVFNSLEEANASPMANVNGKIVLIKQ